MYQQHILTDVDCRSLWEQGKKYGYCVNIKINYYRGLPLSCIDEISLWVDGQPVDSNEMYIQANGKEYPYTYILSDKAPSDEYWKFGEMLRVVVKNGRGISQGVHQVRLRLGTRRSYTPTMADECVRQLTFA